MPVRSLIASTKFCDDLTDYCIHDSEEFALVFQRLRALCNAPEDGERFVFSGNPGDHYLIQCGRFLIIYQFSDEFVWIKTVQLE